MLVLARSRAVIGQLALCVLIPGSGTRQVPPPPVRAARPAPCSSRDGSRTVQRSPVCPPVSRLPTAWAAAIRHPREVAKVPVKICRVTFHLKTTNTGIMEEYMLVSHQIRLHTEIQKAQKPPASRKHGAKRLDPPCRRMSASITLD